MLQQEIRDSLDAAGFSVDAVYGGWQRQPIGPGDDGEFVVVARSAATDCS